MKAPLFTLSPVNVYLFVFNPSTAIGFLGAPIALSIVNCLILSFYILYIRFIQGGDAWGGFCLKEMFNTRLLWEFVKLGIPGCLMMRSEWWAFEIMALLAGILGEKTLAALFSPTCFPLELAYLVIGNSLGSGDGRTAQVASRAALSFGLIGKLCYSDSGSSTMGL
jgi:MATE family multidrug resistance protein